MSKLILAVTDCEHIDYTQEREICEANGIGFVKYDLKDEDEAARVLLVCGICTGWCRKCTEVVQNVHCP